MADYGMKFSQSGADINKAADHEISFTSQWPSVKILKHKLYRPVFAVGQGETAKTLETHNFGFVPAFIPYATDREVFSFSLGRSVMYGNDKEIRLELPGGGGPSPDPDVTIEYPQGMIMMAIDIEQNYQAPKINPLSTPRTMGDNKYGAQFVPEGVNMQNKNLSRFLFNTKAKAPLIHQIAHGIADQPTISSFPGGKDFVIAHDLPYDPIFFVYIEESPEFLPGYYVLRSASVGAIGAGVTASNNIIRVVNPPGKVSVVILKDPFEILDNEQVITV